VKPEWDSEMVRSLVLPELGGYWRPEVLVPYAAGSGWRHASGVPSGKRTCGFWNEILSEEGCVEE